MKRLQKKKHLRNVFNELDLYQNLFAFVILKITFVDNLIRISFIVATTHISYKSILGLDKADMS